MERERQQALRRDINVLRKLPTGCHCDASSQSQSGLVHLKRARFSFKRDEKTSFASNGEFRISSERHLINNVELAFFSSPAAPELPFKR